MAVTRQQVDLVPGLAGQVRVTPQYLGHCYSGRRTAAGPVAHHVFVCWLDGVDLGQERALLRALGHLHVHHWPCPQCGTTWPLDRSGGCLVSTMQAPGDVVKVSDTCRHCAANVHLDATPPGRRASLTWTGMYRTDVDDHEGRRRATAYPCPWGETARVLARQDGPPS